MRKTKIVCTVGPATAGEDGLRTLITSGADVIRLNFSHGDHDGHGQVIERVRRIAVGEHRPIAVLQDLQGPKIRLGEIPTTVLAAHDEIVLSGSQTPPENAIPVGYRWLAEDVRPGDRILLADGTVELQALGTEGEGVLCRVVVGGRISSHKGVNLPRSELRIPSFTDKDRADLLFGLQAGVDVVALSFVRHEDDLEPIAAILDDRPGPRPLVVAKIEKPQAVDRLQQILDRVDAVMVARGDLGVEMPVEEVPIIQKRIIAAARRAAKPVITATQMLGSMVDSPRPTRAEASDVANAVLDGTDAVMLSEESAVGRFPAEAVRMLDRIAEVTEREINHKALLDGRDESLPLKLSAAIARSACILAEDIGAVAIVATTTSGSTARQLARYRPASPIVGLTTNEVVTRQLGLSAGVIPARTGEFSSTDHLIDQARQWCLEHRLAQPGESIVVTAGLPIAAPGTTNLVHAVEV